MMQHITDNDKYPVLGNIIETHTYVNVLGIIPGNKELCYGIAQLVLHPWHDQLYSVLAEMLWG